MGTLKPAVNFIDHIIGAEDAPVTIVEFGDYQCGFCGDAFPIIKEIQEAFGNQIRLVFRHFPMRQAHELAIPAAVAAEAAALQHKFWEMHDAIYDNQYRLSDVLFDELAGQIGLNLDFFRRGCLSKAVIEKIENDFDSGVRSGVNGTPSFYVNGAKFDGGATDLHQMLMESIG